MDRKWCDERLERKQKGRERMSTNDICKFLLSKSFTHSPMFLETAMTISTWAMFEGRYLTAATKPVLSTGTNTLETAQDCCRLATAFWGMWANRTQAESLIFCWIPNLTPPRGIGKAFRCPAKTLVHFHTSLERGDWLVQEFVIRDRAPEPSLEIRLGASRVSNYREYRFHRLKSLLSFADPSWWTSSLNTHTLK